MNIDGYDCLDGICPQRWCWSPGLYQHRGATGSGGSRNTGMSTRCCLHRAYHACPDPIPETGDPAPWGGGFVTFAAMQRICDQAVRADFASPMSVMRNGIEWTAATDGVAALATIGGGFARNITISGHIERLLADSPNPTHVCSLAELREFAGVDNGICKSCDGRGYSGEHEPCAECDGDGELECELGHMHVCQSCCGSGRTNQDCQSCGGRSGREIAPAIIGEVAVNRCLLADVVHDLPGETAWIGWTDRILCVFGVSWILVLSPVLVRDMSAHYQQLVMRRIADCTHRLTHE